MQPEPGEPVLVVGLGKSGQAACEWLARRGCRVRVTESRQTPELAALARRLAERGIAVEVGGHTERFCERSRMVVVSPGVPPSAVPLVWAAARGVPVIGELELAARFCPGRLVAVSGSNGKSSVASWIGAMLQMAGCPSVVAGNIGVPLVSRLPAIGRETTVVVEVSSFQLEHVERFRPSVALLLNVTPNHLDRHHGLEAYVAAKRRLLTQQRPWGWAVLNADDPVCRALRPAVRGRLAEFSLRQPVRGAYRAGRELVLVLRARRVPVATVDDVVLPGEHHVANALAAIAVGGLLGLDPVVMREAIRQFRGLPHRLEPVTTWHDITFVNDAKATTVEAGLRALAACPGRAVLIAGGKDKGSDFSGLTSAAARTVRAAVVIGVDGPRLADVLRPIVPVSQARGMAEAVQQAARLARPGDWVLLSPMCTSFDMFRDFEHRGEAFVRAVEALVALERRPALVEV